MSASNKCQSKSRLNSTIPASKNNTSEAWHFKSREVTGPHNVLPTAVEAGHMPQWHRPINTNKSGTPDFVLLCSPDKNNNAVVMEVKTWWSYTDADLLRIFEVMIQSDGQFIWDHEDISNLILKQVSACITYPLIERDSSLR